MLQKDKKEDSMMDTVVRNEIEELNPWYQTIDFGDGVKSPGVSSCGDPLWFWIRIYLPKKLKGVRILDLGSNAGIYCIRAALEGAEVVGVEHSEKWMGQAKYVRKYFEGKHDRKLNIRYIQSRMEDVKEDLGRFDAVLATAVLYYVREEEQKRLVKWICSITENVVARYRGRIRMDRFNPMFWENGFGVVDILRPAGKNVYYLVNYKPR